MLLTFMADDMQEGFLWTLKSHTLSKFFHLRNKNKTNHNCVQEYTSEMFLRKIIIKRFHKVTSVKITLEFL